MGEMVASTLAQEGVSRVFSSISAKFDDRASRAHNVRRLDIALSRVEYAIERTAKMPITCVSLLRRWKMLMSVYNEGVHLLNKHKLPDSAGQVVVRSSYYYLQRIATAAYFSLSSLASGLNKQQCLSSSVVQIFEGYADSADKFVADVESAYPLRHDTFFPYPFVRQLLQGKYLSYDKVKGRQRLWFDISPLAWRRGSATLRVFRSRDARQKFLANLNTTAVGKHGHSWDCDRLRAVIRITAQPCSLRCNNWTSHPSA
ncbi:hypothetical protein PVAP13_2KG021900 [Panicum virgatum]|uniref:Uncharacterized protein n=1 Tax=Panicum virgatum TaxID=38727 RepID=A0A8T0VX61_PANVG|nr:hypothetical protein PVAP13_2KG021900 [Panicum virgatum]